MLNLKEQKIKSNYQSHKEYKKTIHAILHTKDLKIEPPLRKIFEFLWNCKGGVTKTSIEKISKIMTKKLGRGYKPTTINTGIKLAKKYNLLQVENEHSGKTGYKNCSWKIVAEAEVIHAFIQERLPFFEDEIELEIECEFECEFELRQNAENPWESKDEATKNEPHKSLIKQNKTLLKDINISIPISSSNIKTDIEPVKVKDKFQSMSEDIFHSTIPNTIKHYLKDNISLLLAKNFNIMQFERFVVRYEHFHAFADYYDMEYLNEQHLLHVTRQLITQVDYIKNTEALMRDWADRHLKNRHEKKIAKKERSGFLGMFLDEQDEVSNRNQRPRKIIRTELLPDWFDEATEERKEHDKAQEKARVEKQKAEINDLLKELGIENDNFAPKENRFEEFDDYRQANAERLEELPF